MVIGTISKSKHAYMHLYRVDRKNRGPWYLSPKCIVQDVHCCEYFSGVQSVVNGFRLSAYSKASPSRPFGEYPIIPIWRFLFSSIGGTWGYVTQECLNCLPLI